jgi:hypothetical protein
LIGESYDDPMKLEEVVPRRAEESFDVVNIPEQLALLRVKIYGYVETFIKFELIETKALRQRLLDNVLPSIAARLSNGIVGQAA